MLTFIRGSDSYLVRQAAEEAAHAAAATHGNVAITRIDCSLDTAHDALSHIFKYPSFFQEHRVVLAQRAASSPDVVGLIRDHYTEPTVTLIATHADAEGLDAQTKKQCAALETCAPAILIEKPAENAAVAWVQKACDQYNVRIESTAAHTLIHSCGGDFWRLAQEIEKLAATSTNITENLVKELVTMPAQERDPWALGDALYAGDKRKAIAALWQATSEGTAPELLLGTIAASLRALLVVGEPSADRARAAKASGIHPFVLGKATRGAHYYQPERVKQAHLSLAELDRASKSGGADALDGLFSVMMNMVL